MVIVKLASSVVVCVVGLASPKVHQAVASLTSDLLTLRAFHFLLTAYGGVK